MRRNQVFWRALVALGVLAAAAVGASALRSDGSTTTAARLAEGPSARSAVPAGAKQVARPRSSGPIVTSVTPVISPPLRDILPGPPTTRVEREPEDLTPRGGPGPANWRDPAIQTAPARGEMPAPIVSFDGIANLCGCLPPDSEGDVGPNHYVEWVNVQYAIYSKTGATVKPPADGNTIFAALPATEFCQSQNNGDPLVQYDQFANRWVLSQFAFSPSGFGPYYECVAVSTTPDPTGSYCLYAFNTAATVFPDYPKMGVWPDAYYFSIAAFPDVQFTDGQLYSPGAFAVERARMIACQTAQMVYFDHENLPALDESVERMLPSDIDGVGMPPAGEPNYYLTPNTTTGNTIDQWEFHVDWVTPANSTFVKTNTISVPAFDPTIACGGNPPRRCVPQPAPGVALDVFSNPGRARLTYELNYRNFGTHRSLVVNHNVDLGTNHVGTRWYEIRNPETNPTTAFQASSYNPDAAHRWMGAAAMDNDGNLAIGYSVSSASNPTVFPSLRYAGRLATDPLDQLTQGEASLVVGAGAQTHTSSRWGDYSHLSVDPIDDCTFWYIGEYYASTSSAGWRTRIGSFKFPSCLAPTAVRVQRFDSRRQGGAVAVTWKTASEAGAVGFNVYRSIGTGAFRKVNLALIAARHAGAARGASYRFVDRPGTRRTAVTYRLQIVEQNGKRSWHTIGSAA